MEQEYSKYDSISYGFFIQNEIFVDGDPNCGKILVLDSIKNIQIITLRKYNSIYDSLDTITSNFKVYLFQPDTNSWSFYNSIEECFNKSGNIPADRDLKLKLISPPTLCPIYVLPETGDTIYAARTIQFKFILYLTDSRKFELISKPIFAIP